MACDCAVRGFSLNGFSVRTHQDTGHQAEGSISLRHNVRLNISVVILTGPYKTALTFQSLRYLNVHLHNQEKLNYLVIDETVLVPRSRLFEAVFIIPELCFQSNLVVRVTFHKFPRKCP